jgi:hypothetical protein
MLKKVLLNFVIMSSVIFAMSASVVQNASKNKLGCIKGLGIKRVQAIVKHRTDDKINTLDELLNIKGIGKVTLKNIKNDTQKKLCTTFNKSVEQKSKKKKKNIRAE